MEDSETPRSAFQRRRTGASRRRARTENEAGSRPRFEIVIETQTVRLSVDGEVTAETLAALTTLASGLRPNSPVGAAVAVRHQPAGPQGVLPHANEPASAADGQDTPEPQVVRCLPQAVTGTFRIAKDIVTELIARLVGHGLGFPP